MQIHEHSKKYDAFAMEERRIDIPFRKKFVLCTAAKGRRILDVGCNSGKLGQLMSQQNNEVWGLEINPIAAQKAEQRGIRVKVGNAEDGLPFESDFFDMVHAGALIEILYDTQQFVEECFRVLKPGGDLVLAFTNLNSWENRLKVLRGDYLSGIGAYPADRNGDCLRIFNLQKIRELVERVGFEWGDVRGVPVLQETRFPIQTLSSVAGWIFPEMSQLVLLRVGKPR